MQAQTSRVCMQAQTSPPPSPPRTFHTHESRRRSQRGFLELDWTPSPVRTPFPHVRAVKELACKTHASQDKWEQGAWQDKAQFCKTKGREANVPNTASGKCVQDSPTRMNQRAC